MKLLYLVPILTYRGSEQVVSQLIEYLQTQQHSVTIITPYKDDTIQISGARIICPPQIIMQLCKNPFLYLIISPLVILIYTIQYIKDTDLIITDNFPCLPIATPLSILFNKKCLLSIHGLEIETSVTQSFLEKLHHHTVTSINKLTSPIVKHVVVNSPKVQRNAQKMWPNAKISVLIPPVSLPNISYSTSNPANHTLLSVGVLHPLKNQSLLIESLALVKQSYPDTTLLLVGDGDQAPLIKLATKLGIEKSITFKGYVPHKAIYQHYQAATLLLQPAYYPEGLSLTVFEAMLAKKLAICAAGAGAADIIQAENIGIVVEPTVSNFTNEILKYLTNPTSYTTIINNGYNYVQKNLTAAKYGKSFELEILSTLSDIQ